MQPTILGFFGRDFQAARQACTILMAAQLVNASCGPVGYLLLMTDFRRAVVRAFSAALLFNFMLLLVLIPQWGLVGAAAGTAATILSWNAILTW